MSDTPELVFKRKVAELHAGQRFEEALQLILKEEVARPSAPEVLVAKAATLGILGKYEEGIKAADEAIAADPNNFFPYHSKGVDLYHLGRFSEAVEALDAALALNPHFPTAIDKKISALTMIGRFQEAAQIYESSDLPEVFDNVMYNNLGFMYLELGQYQKASPFLYGSKVIYPFEWRVYYNLARLWWRLGDPLRSAKHWAACGVLRVLDKIGALKKFEEKHAANRPHISESTFHLGSGRLFASSTQEREIRAILKLLRGFNASALCNDTWNWFAVNVPYQAAEQNGFEGDIDIIVSRPRRFGHYDAGFSYRGFQVKTIIVNRAGAVHSAKRGKQRLKKIKKQLDVLKAFGCEQIFLLELFVLERGYSSLNQFPPPTLQQEIAQKAAFLQSHGYGYVIFAEEPSHSHNDEMGGVVHMPINVLRTTSNPIGENFQKLADAIDAFRKRAAADPAFQNLKSIGQRGPHVVGYCRPCKNFTYLIQTEMAAHVCARCRQRAY